MVLPRIQIRDLNTKSNRHEITIADSIIIDTTFCLGGEDVLNDIQTMKNHSTISTCGIISTLKIRHPPLGHRKNYLGVIKQSTRPTALYITSVHEAMFIQISSIG